ncbi:MAG: FkbM family methyltransferase [Deltaproteobacteria bacterium]
MSSLIKFIKFAFIRDFYATLARVPLVGAALRAVVRMLIPYGKRVWLQVSGGIIKGLWMNLDPRYELDYWRGNWESGLEGCFVEYLKPGGVFYDVGAHIGYFSMVAARLVGDGGRVFTFEPDPDNASCVRRHIARNRLSQIEITEAAVWSGSGSLTFKRAIERSSRNMGAVDAEGVSGSSEGMIRVSAVSLDEFCRSHPLPSMIKIDVEGGEIEVLRGATGLLTGKDKPVVLCEVHSSENLDAFQSLMRSFGYSVRPLGQSTGEFPAHFLARPEILAQNQSGKGSD